MPPNPKHLLVMVCVRFPPRSSHQPSMCRGRIPAYAQCISPQKPCIEGIAESLWVCPSDLPYLGLTVCIVLAMTFNKQCQCAGTLCVVVCILRDILVAPDIVALAAPCVLLWMETKHEPGSSPDPPVATV
mmetsp:Transcript_3330/g.7412  ORF Transcript_3330/g.7412 Transcript_3330/m.7412 type:complete len:130 (-) Transcript_3330:942-1331(-)